MTRIVRSVCIVFILGSAAACATGTRQSMLQWTDPYLDVPTRMAVRSAAIGFRPAIVAQGVETVCVGRVMLRTARRTGDEAELEAQRAWERRVVEMIDDLFPVVVPADACQVQSMGEVVLRGSEEPAVMFLPTVLDEYDGWVRSVVTIRSKAVRNNRRDPSQLTGEFTLRTFLDGSVWRVEESWCVAYSTCETFPDDAVIRSMETDVTQPLHSRGG